MRAALSSVTYPMQEDEMEQATQIRAGEMTDGSDFPSREQLAVLEVAAVKFGSVAIDRDGDLMRLSTPDGMVTVTPDGERVETAGLDYMAITRMRIDLAAEADRLRYGDVNTYEVGIAIGALERAATGLFDALNVLSSYLGDKQADDAIDAWLAAKGYQRNAH